MNSRCVVEQAVPDECKRMAASRPNGWQNYVYTPHADDLAMYNPDRKAQVRCASATWSSISRSLCCPVVLPNFCWPKHLLAAAAHPLSPKRVCWRLLRPAGRHCGGWRMRSNCATVFVIPAAAISCIYVH